MTVPPKPFLRWAGGKAGLLDALLPAMPSAPLAPGRTYFEPVLGGGALFWALRHAGLVENAILSDLNPRLVMTYAAVRDRVEELIEATGRLLERHGPDHYYAVRASPPASDDFVGTAAWVLYLNRTCFNGLWRENRRGGFNTPIGDRSVALDADNLRACSVALQRTVLLHEDFQHALARVHRGDLVYLDPPYVPRSASASFTKYTRHGFGLEDQAALRDLAIDLLARGAHVVLSNHDVPAVRDLFASTSFELRPVSARRSIAARTSSRARAAELVIVGCP